MIISGTAGQNLLSVWGGGVFLLWRFKRWPGSSAAVRPGMGFGSSGASSGCTRRAERQCPPLRLAPRSQAMEIQDPRDREDPHERILQHKISFQNASSWAVVTTPSPHSSGLGQGLAV